MNTIKPLSERIDQLEDQRKNLDMEIRSKSIFLSELDYDLYTLKTRFLHIKEIYRIAEIEFSRLKRRAKNELTDLDVIELEKWIGRVKGPDGFISIIEAIQELRKYLPGNVSNVYALVQKIIIDGAYKDSKKSKKA